MYVHKVPPPHPPNAKVCYEIGRKRLGTRFYWVLVYNIIQLNKCCKRLWESKGLRSRADRRRDSLVKLVCRTQWQALTRVAGSDRRYLRLIVSAKPYVVSIALRLQESSSPLSGYAALPADLGTGRGVVIKHAQLFAIPPPTTLRRAAGFIDQLI